MFDERSPYAAPTLFSQTRPALFTPSSRKFFSDDQLRAPSSRSPQTRASGLRITAQDIQFQDLDTRALSRATLANPPGSLAGLGDQVLEFERGRILEALQAARGNRSKAARSLELPRTTLITKLKRFDIRD